MDILEFRDCALSLPLSEEAMALSGPTAHH